MLSSLTTKLALKKAGIPSDILDFQQQPEKSSKSNQDDQQPPQSWGSWMSIRSLPLTVQPWLSPPPPSVAVGRVPGIGDKAPVDRERRIVLGGRRRTLLVFLRCVGCACMLSNLPVPHVDAAPLLFLSLHDILSFHSRAVINHQLTC
jgi:hypothetical protein